MYKSSAVDSLGAMKVCSRHKQVVSKNLFKVCLHLGLKCGDLKLSSQFQFHSQKWETSLPMIVLFIISSSLNSSEIPSYSDHYHSIATRPIHG